MLKIDVKHKARLYNNIVVQYIVLSILNGTFQYCNRIKQLPKHEFTHELLRVAFLNI